MVVKLNPAGTQALYVTYIGGEDLDIINAIAVDPHGAAYVTGPTNSRTFPLTLTPQVRGEAVSPMFSWSS
jgi:hypothetical protein